VSTNSKLLVRPKLPVNETGIITQVTANQAGWDLLNMEVRRFSKEATWQHQTSNFETVIVVLSGSCSVSSDKGNWPSIGQRKDVFSGMGSALYLSRHTEFTLTAMTDTVEVAHCWVPTNEDHPPKLVTPEDCSIEIRGGNNATRQIVDLIPPGFDCQSIVCVEVYTPSGNWSSYPPHKHDVHREDEQGNLLEADLEEFYFHKIDKPKGYAFQRVYTDNRALDETMTVHDNDIVLVPEGYHPVGAAYGFNSYYLNFLAGTAQSLANSDDPDYAWIKDTWDKQDPRVPLVTHETKGFSE